MKQLKNTPRVDGLVRFRLLPKANSFRLAGKRYFSGDEIQLTKEQADRFNSDLFAKIEPAAVTKEPEPTAAAAPVLQNPENAKPQNPKTAKKPGYARKPKP